MIKSTRCSIGTSFTIVAAFLVLITLTSSTAGANTCQPQGGNWQQICNGVADRCPTGYYFESGICLLNNNGPGVWHEPYNQQISQCFNSCNEKLSACSYACHVWQANDAPCNDSCSTKVYGDCQDICTADEY